MNGRVLASSLALAALALAGCARPASPAPSTLVARPPAVQETPIANPSAVVRATIKRLTTPWEFRVVNGRKVASFVATTLPNVTAVRSAYAGARFPTYTAGRKLEGIVIKWAAFPQSFPRTSLWLLYQDGLQISEADYVGGPPDGPDFGPFPAPGTVTTDVAGASAQAFMTRGLPKHPDLAVVRWETGAQAYIVSAPHITVAQAVAIGRSLVK